MEAMAAAPLAGVDVQLSEWERRQQKREEEEEEEKRILPLFTGDRKAFSNFTTITTIGVLPRYHHRLTETNLVSTVATIIAMETLAAALTPTVALVLMAAAILGEIAVLMSILPHPLRLSDVLGNWGFVGSAFSQKTGFFG